MYYISAFSGYLANNSIRIRISHFESDGLGYKAWVEQSSAVTVSLYWNTRFILVYYSVSFH